MRGGDKRTGELFSYVDLEKRVRSDHPLRAIRGLVNEALVALEHEFSALYAPIGRPSIPPEKLLRAMLLQAFYSIRSVDQMSGTPVAANQMLAVLRTLLEFGVPRGYRGDNPAIGIKQLKVEDSGHSAVV